MQNWKVNSNEGGDRYWKSERFKVEGSKHGAQQVLSLLGLLLCCCAAAPVSSSSTHDSSR